MLSEQALQEISREVAKYPADRKQSAVMAALRIAQEEHGWLSQSLMDYIAGILELRPIQVYEVATFYSMYDLERIGRHKICVCTNVSCMLCASSDVVTHLERRLGIKLGETTADGRYTLKEVECLGACGGAPAMQIGHNYYEHLTPESLDAILDGLD
jgi:NADH-quinone oxidoreductase subunit E